MNEPIPQDDDLLDTSGPAPDIFESMGLVKPDLGSLSIRTAPAPQEPSSISGGDQVLIPVVASEGMRAAIIREFDRQEECWRYDADAMLAVIIAAASLTPTGEAAP